MEKKLTDSGAKAYQRSDTENRVQQYSDWHRTLNRSLLMLDVDFIEWRFRNGNLVPVGVMEITRVDSGKIVGIGYLGAIVQRYEERDIQARAIRYVANALKTKAFIILFREGCTEFWVYDLTEKRGWSYFTLDEYVSFLESL